MKRTPKKAIAIFVKTPGLSPIKTRLAEGIGKTKAMEFYNLALDCIEDLTKEIDATPHWAIGEKGGLTHPHWQNFNRLWTGNGDLGKRQHHIYATLLKSYDEVMLIGTDCPQLSPQDISAAFDALSEHKFAIGPATDGGYTYLCGNTKITLDQWKAVEYSQSDTLKNLLKQLNRNHILLQQYSDIDHKQDLETALQEMPKDLTSAQKALCAWIYELKYQAPDKTQTP